MSLLSNKYYIPKGSLCANCQNLARDCSFIDFSKMSVIDTVVIEGITAYRVKCMAYLKRAIEGE